MKIQENKDLLNFSGGRDRGKIWLRHFIPVVEDQLACFREWRAITALLLATEPVTAKTSIERNSMLPT